MGKYLTAQAVKWSIEHLAMLPKNQTALLHFLIFAHNPKVDRAYSSDRKQFVEEFYRYFGGPIKGGGIACYDPFAGEWLAEGYLNSTVFGRLLVGSHKWTEGDEAFFKREPEASGWPAVFSLTEKGFDNLLYRNSPPCLKYDYRLPLKAVAIYYFRFEDLSNLEPSSIEDLVERYKQRVLSKHPRLSELFREGPTFLDAPFVETPLTEDEKISCYPLAPSSDEPKTRQHLYVDDVEYMKGRLREGQTIADYVHNLIQGGEA